MATKGRLAVSILTAALASGALLAAAPQTVVTQRATNHLLAQRTQMGLDQDHSFAVRISQNDELEQVHTRFDKLYNGVKVWGGDLITHSNADGEVLGITTNHTEKVRLNVSPTLGVAEALAVVHQNLNPMGPYALEPTTELVIYPMTVDIRRPNRSRVSDEELNAEDVVRTVVRNALAYHVHVELENDRDGIRQMDYMVDAHTGAVIKSWNTLHTSAATGTGNSQYNGVISINTNSVTSGFELRDTTRGTTTVVGGIGNAVTNSNHAADTSTATGTIYTDADNTWGDSANYVEGSSTTAANGQTAAVDAMFGMSKSWDYYKLVLGRNGIDGTGKSTYSRVHVSNSYDNAFWSDSCFCMTYGDGSSFTTLTSIDVAGHEMSHGVCATTANLTYSGESGGLNESNSDIHGTMIEYYSRGAAGATTVPSTGGNFTIGEQLSSTPLRYMQKPSLDGSSPDAWSSSVGGLDVHYSSGPSNRMFYFLSQGATTSGNGSTTLLPTGMTGIGNDHAARIAFRALSTYMTSSTNYAAARTAYINAAKDLYTAGSAEEQAVWNAFHGINVGAAWTSTTPTAPTITTQPLSQSVTTGATATFTVAASGTAPFTYQWRKNAVNISGATAASYTTPATVLGDSGSTFSVVVTNSVGSATSNNATLTVSSVPPSTTFTEVEPNDTIAGANAVAGTYTAIKGYHAATGNPDFFALTLAAGQKVTINMTGPTGVDWDLALKNSAGTNLATSTGSTATEAVTYTNAGASAVTVYANVYVYSGTSATPYNLALTYVTPPPSVTYNEVEANNTIATANAVPATSTKIVGYIGSSTDNDYFAVAVGAGRTLAVGMTGPTGSTYDYDLYFYNAAGTSLASGTGSTTTENVSWVNGATATTVYVAVKRYAGSSTTTPYNLTVSR